MNCLKCRRVMKCLTVCEVSLQIFLKCKVLTDGLVMFENTAAHCSDFSNKKKRQVIDGQYSFDME